MVVMVPRERWTDEKLDKAFGRIDGDLRELLAAAVVASAAFG